MILNEIPPFYRPDPAVVRGGEPPQQLRRLARVMLLKKKAEETNIEEEDFQLLFRRLSEMSTPQDDSPNLAGKSMTFEAFISLSRAEDLHPVFRKQLFTPMMYFAFPKTYDGFVYADPIFSCALETRENRKIRYDLGLSDKDNSGYLTEMQLVSYFDQFMKEVPDDHFDFYIAVVVRKFMFFLARENRVAIRDMMASPILTEFKQRHIMQDSWFSSRNIYWTYNMFVDLDADQNMLLSKNEFRNLSFDQDRLPRVTDLIVNRLFARKIRPMESNPNGELDFRNFLDFVLAHQNRGHAVSIKYFWELLDMNDVGYLTSQDILELVRSVLNQLGTETLHRYAGGDLKPEDVKDEIYDMANGSSSIYITFDDLIKSGQAGIILQMVTDPSGFLTYEQREFTLSQANRDAAGDAGGLEGGSNYEAAASLVFGDDDVESGGQILSLEQPGAVAPLSLSQSHDEENSSPVGQPRTLSFTDEEESLRPLYLGQAQDPNEIEVKAGHDLHDYV